ncbi:type 2 lanthipeptide synthetase LanM family protein [Streptomyces sp. A012304]|uniref:type 2 lanthipeptide synthetase LanM family protein n=1 Tax=Streptomyces sp. A012304 TaxID=375446 RepID=UPI002231AA43|nr:type 2 lanthipeptide synthetase LanM family protein [Streptomyces sp. A012304]GKQ36402.1 lanthionine synthetase [Streptomyces sp. A012304]
MDSQPVTTAGESDAFSDAAWYRATPLHERVAADGHGPTVLDPDPARTARRLARWRAEPAFADERERLARRLLDDGITEERLGELLAEPAEALRNRLLARWDSPPDWLLELAEAFTRARYAPAHEPELPVHDAARILFLVEPLIAQAAGELRSVLSELAAEHPGVFDAGAVSAALLRHLCGTLLATLSRTVILELQAARLQGLLEGDTPQERFAHFVRGLRDRDRALDILREYPVLAQTLVTSVRLWTEASVEFVRRVADDHATLVAHFFHGQEPGPLVEVACGVGDPHRGGRSVSILRFASGQHLVYKPRALSVDCRFQRLLRWLNDKGAQPRYRVLTVVDRGDYGWAEHVTAAPCTSKTQVEGFYRRQGGYLALLYCLHAIDFHYENLIAVGEHPVLVDLEALFHPNRESLGDVAEDAAAVMALDSSVLMTGLLPQRRLPQDTGRIEGEPGEFSGLGGADGQLSPTPVAVVADPATDTMRVVRNRVEMPSGQHRATLPGSSVDVLDHVDQVLDGFTSVCTLLRHNQEELLAPGGPVAAFADVEVRCVIRPTQAYAAMLSEGVHPDLMRDGLARDRYFDNLWTSPEDNRVLNTVFPCERHDLYRRDVPVFTARPGQRHLWCTQGHTHRDVMKEPVLDMVRRRIARLDDEDVQRQRWIIRASFAALTLGDGSARWPVCDMEQPERPAEYDELLEAACRAGDRLELLALDDGETVGWLGLSLLGQRVWALQALGGDLYGGLSGISLFFGYLGAVTKTERYTRLAERSLESVRRYTRWRVGLLATDEDPLLSVFEHAPGGLFTMTHLGALWHRDDLLDEARELSGQLEPAIKASRTFDIINGTAGHLCMLLGLHAVRPEPALLDLAVQCGDRLLETAETMPRGIAWRDDADATPLTGFSHGASGVAHALLRLAAACGEDRFRKAAEQAMEYERSLFVPDRGNWPDLREAATELAAQGIRPTSAFMTAWCHGAPGIGLARVEALRHKADDAVLREELAAALATTEAGGLNQNHSLCHGSLGNIELLTEAARFTGSAEAHQRSRLAARTILDGIDRLGWQCGVPGGVETPGLMTGLAGIGYGLLRLAAPHQVPSVLTLSPPAAPAPGHD